jgi:hypothetical protein
LHRHIEVDSKRQNVYFNQYNISITKVSFFSYG